MLAMVSLTRYYRANQTSQNPPGDEANGTFRYIGGFEEQVMEVQPSILLARRRAAISLLTDLLKALLLKVPYSGTHGMVARTHLLHGLCNPLSPSQQFSTAALLPRSVMLECENFHCLSTFMSLCMLLAPSLRPLLTPSYITSRVCQVLTPYSSCGTIRDSYTNHIRSCSRMGVILA